ncbi:putative 1-acylglycerol-3-phosphate O-acyltransferase [Helianthus annuus]|nr:putative 1-acylglycerol-3-phosphate O-acyltransferase [Helianthus annuus]
MALAAVVVLPIGLLFLLSGLIINFLQALFFVIVRPCSKNVYRKINAHLAQLLWLEVVWLFDWWAHIKVDLYIDSETLELMGKEHALLICNHKSDIDWLIGWVLAQVIGWSMWFTEYIFLERSWAKDEHTLKAGFENLTDFPMPFWLAVFVEGTRFTQAKLIAAQEYAIAMNLPIPRNLLIPRTKGFVAAVNHLRSFVPAIYNCTVAIPKDEPLPTILRMFRGRSSTVHVHIKRHLICELPETDSGIKQWCRDRFVEKVVIFWSWLLLYGAIKFFEWCSFSWGTIAFCALLLLFVVILMQILILFSQSEKSDSLRSQTINYKEDTLNQKLIP